MDKNDAVTTVSRLSVTQQLPSVQSGFHGFLQKIPRILTFFDRSSLLGWSTLDVVSLLREATTECTISVATFETMSTICETVTSICKALSTLDESLATIETVTSFDIASVATIKAMSSLDISTVTSFEATSNETVATFESVSCINDSSVHLFDVSASVSVCFFTSLVVKVMGNGRVGFLWVDNVGLMNDDGWSMVDGGW